MAKQVMPVPDLGERTDDLLLTDEEYLGIGLFARTKRKPSLDKYPGTLVLRRYRKDAEIYRQGETGWTAFYVLTSEEALVILEPRLRAARQVTWPAADNRLKGLEQEVASLRERVREIQAPDASSELRRVGKAKLPFSRALLRQAGTESQQHAPADPSQAPLHRTIYTAADGSIRFSRDSLGKGLFEGQLFGEMSCLYRTPRGETVKVERDCYVLEMLRNILDQLMKDPQFNAETEGLYRQRVLQRLPGFSLFADLTARQFAEIEQDLEPVRFEPGQVIFDEHERPDGVYVIRNGLVKAMKNVSSLLRRGDVPSVKALCAALLEGEAQAATPRGKVWQLLSEAARALIRKGAADPAAVDAADLVDALNELIMMRQLPDARELKPLIDAPAYREGIRGLPEKRKEWTDLDVRRCNRALLVAIYPGAIGTAPQSGGLPCLLALHSPGEFVGELGGRSLHRFTCIADGHPNQYGLVELVRIPEATFARMLEASQALRERVEKERVARREQTLQRLQVPVWDESQQVQLSKPFQKLGLIQGQQLMLIDLDRCTRCDECVQACVRTHDDGRTRLFLDGPRFGKYLVPVTCRSCLDPVCLIGCPVGSIVRGDNRQILIKDWCIGCGLCASNCPYGSIQMHTVGIVAEGAGGWRYLPKGAAVAGDWFRPRYRDRGWLSGVTPFVYDREFQEGLARSLKKAGPWTEFYFRRAFTLADDPAPLGKRFRLELSSAASAVSLWVNGVALRPDKEQRNKREYWLPQPSSDSPKGVLRRGGNVLAVSVAGDFHGGETLLQLRLDEVRKPSIPGAIAQDLAEEIIEKPVTERAVVCDLCSALPQGPACVTACPHDAALRVDARFNFPSR
jgi:Fe-S-cluster-containing hydrogenase component 2/CRP-like cAMP-binding protein